MLDHVLQDHTQLNVMFHHALHVTPQAAAVLLSMMAC